MTAIPLKHEYRPTLGELLAPSWQRLPAILRALVILAAAGLIAGAIGLALTLERTSMSHGGPVPFSFEYRTLQRTATPPGQYARVVRYKHEILDESLTVGPLLLPPYDGSLTAELPLYAASYIQQLSQRYEGFTLDGEGKTRVNTVPGYQVLYSAIVQGRRMDGRDVLLTPEKAGVRRGVIIAMLASSQLNPHLDSDSGEVAGEGPLDTALHSFSFE